MWTTPQAIEQTRFQEIFGLYAFISLLYKVKIVHCSELVIRHVYKLPVKQLELKQYL